MLFLTNVIAALVFFSLTSHVTSQRWKPEDESLIELFSQLSDDEKLQAFYLQVSEEAEAFNDQVIFFILLLFNKIFRSD